MERRGKLSELIFIGAVHRDPAGATRLARILDELKPAIISLEVSPASVRLRQDWGRAWQKLFKKRLGALSLETGLSPGELMSGAGMRGVFEYLRLPYEYRAAMRYARSNGCPLFLLDDSGLAASYLNRVESEILSQRNLNLLAQAKRGNGLAREVDDEYSRANHLVFKPGVWSGPQTGDQKARAARDAALGQKLRLLHQGIIRRAGQAIEGDELVASLIIAPEAVGYVPEKVSLPSASTHVYIGGWEHLVEDEEGERLYSLLKDMEPARRLCYHL